MRLTHRNFWAFGWQRVCCEEPLRIRLLFLLGVVDFLIFFAGFHQLVMGADCGDPSVIQDDDPVGIPHRADPLRDQEGGGMRLHRMEMQK